MSKVLIVDDEKSIRVSFKKRLERENMIVHVANGWIESKEILKHHEFDVIFLDNKMPGILGVDMIPKILKLYPDTTIILMTCEPSIDTIKLALKHGAVDYLEKPITGDQLLKIVFKSIERRKLIIERRKLKKQNKYYKDKIDNLIFNHNDFNTDEFHKLATGLINHRKESSQILKDTKHELLKALNLIRSI